MTLDRKLSAKAQEMLGASDEERRAHIDRRLYIPYRTATEFLEEMEDILNHPTTNRMPNMLIVGRSNSGKTELLQEFQRLHPAEVRPQLDSAYVPVFYIQAPPGPMESLFLSTLLAKFGVEAKRNESAENLLSHVMQVLSRVQTKVLLVDELNALLAGSSTKQRFFLNMLKYIGNELRISIVAAGTNEAAFALQSDAQLESRFPQRLLPRWENNKEFRQLLASFESVLPLRQPSNLVARDVAAKIYGLSEGVLGDVAKLIRSAAKMAVGTTEMITGEVIDNCPHVLRKGGFDEQRY